jgi:hypothetical protein
MGILSLSPMRVLAALMTMGLLLRAAAAAAAVKFAVFTEYCDRSIVVSNDFPRIA